MTTQKYLIPDLKNIQGNNEHVFIFDKSFSFLIIVLLPLLSPPFFHLGEHVQVFLLTTITCLWCSLKIFNLRHHPILNLSPTDIFLLFYLLYGIIHSIWIKPVSRELPIYLEWASLVLIYILVRSFSFKNKQHIQIYIIISTICQAAIGIIQHFHFLPSNHNWFPVTGSFSNPGPYGGFLVIGLISCCGYILENFRIKKHPIHTILSIGILIPIIYALVLSDSRAAWLGGVIALGYICYQQTKLNHIKLSVYYKIIILILSISLIVYFYFYKQGSADARLFIWQISLNMFYSAPLTGVGIGAFSSHYMNDQAMYFSQYPNSSFITSANNNHLAFNEFIHLGCEQGIIGLILFSCIIISIFKKHQTTTTNLKASFIALLIFSCFSYPAEITSLKILFPIFLGLTAQPFSLHVKQYNIFYKHSIIFLIVSILILQSLCVYSWYTYNQAFLLILKTNQLKTTAKLQQIDYYAKQLHSPTYLFEAGKIFLQHNQLEKTLSLWQQLETKRPSTPLACKIGQVYRLKGNPEQAQAYFLKAHHMTPSHITPLYELFITFLNTNKKHEAQILARKITELKVFTTNTITLKARKEANDFLKTTK